MSHLWLRDKPEAKLVIKLWTLVFSIKNIAEERLSKFSKQKPVFQTILIHIKASRNIFSSSTIKFLLKLFSTGQLHTNPVLEKQNWTDRCGEQSQS